MLELLATLATIASVYATNCDKLRIYAPIVGTLASALWLVYSLQPIQLGLVVVNSLLGLIWLTALIKGFRSYMIRGFKM